MSSTSRLGHRGFYRLSVVSVLSLGTILGLAATPVWGQSTATGTVSGQVVNALKAVAPGTEVKLLDPTTNKVLTATTNESGRYIFLNVAPGTYNITFSKAGFSAYQVNAQTVNVGEVLTINAILAVGAVSTTVEVTSVAGAELQTTNSTVGSTISQFSMIYLPNLGREASTLAIFQPGVSPEGSVAGAMYDQNTFQLGWGQQLQRYGRQHECLHPQLRVERRADGYHAHSN
jgi:Carboxypeptidase regulatory-like domain